jgi:hypothetical protein
MDASLAVTVLACVTLAGQEEEKKQPKKTRDPAYIETIRVLEKRLAAKDIDGSLAVFASPDQPGGSVRLRRRIERMAKGWDAQKTFQVADHRAKGSCAVVVILETPEDPDPMYLVRSRMAGGSFRRSRSTGGARDQGMALPDSRFDEGPPRYRSPARRAR